MGTFEASIQVREIGNKSVKFDLQSDLNGEVTLAYFLKFTKTSLLTIADDVLREEQRKGFDKNPIVVVDGSPRKPVIAVSPLGKIEFISSQVQSLDVVRTIYEAIMSRSKVVTGTYIEGNFIFFNGQVVATNMAEMERWLATKPKMESGNIVRFVNVVPYARRLERLGVTKQRTQNKRVKSRDKQKRSGETILGNNGVYFLSSRVASKNFKNNISIRFEFILGSTLGVQGIPAIAKNGKPLRRNYAPPKGQKATKKNTGPYLYPSIKLTIRDKGTV